MALISINNLTFCYEGGYHNVFSDVSFQIDTDWKLGFCGRNGRGKTTFLKLLMGQLDYKGTISSPVDFVYFPFEVQDKSKTVLEIAQSIAPAIEPWELQRELNLLKCKPDCMYCPFEELSGGEQTKTLLAILFSRGDNFLLIDEPTNHLDAEARQHLANFLATKKSFILVSHDRNFLDGCIDHILSINKTDIQIQSGNFSSWLTNKSRQDSFETAQNKKLKSEIERLKDAARQKSDWSGKAERKKQGAADKGFMGHKAAKQMKTAKLIEQRQNKSIDDKSKLLKNIESDDDLFLRPLVHNNDILVAVKNLSITLGGRQLFCGLSLNIEGGDRISICGKNGSGKTTLLNLLAAKNAPFEGEIRYASGLKISYLPQDTSNIVGSLREFSRQNSLDETLFMTNLARLGLEPRRFDLDISSFSYGQKKKVCLAKSLSEQAHLYIWDEPLNYIDIISRIQIEQMILRYKPTVVFVEHDNAFSDSIATKKIVL